MTPPVVVEDRTEDFKKFIDGLKKGNVLVGIPETTTDRKDNDESINNATILAINEFGSPANNIPARPVMAIGIKNAQEPITEIFKNAAKKGLKGGLEAYRNSLERVGIVASNSVKKAINSQEGIEPPADSTLASRKRAGFKGTKALIVTGQLRNAITYVVRGNW